MKTFQKSVIASNQEYKKQLKHEWSTTHHFKSSEHQHDTFQGIGYSEWQCEKLNGYRNSDRPYGKSGNTLYKDKKNRRNTLSKETAKHWIHEGCEVWIYAPTGALTTIWNARRCIVKLMKNQKVAVKYQYN